MRKSASTLKHRNKESNHNKRLVVYSLWERDSTALDGSLLLCLLLGSAIASSERSTLLRPLGLATLLTSADTQIDALPPRTIAIAIASASLSLGRAITASACAATSV